MTRLALNWMIKATVIEPILDRRPGIRGVGFIIRPPRNSSTTLLAFLPHESIAIGATGSPSRAISRPDGGRAAPRGEARQCVSRLAWPSLWRPSRWPSQRATCAVLTTWNRPARSRRVAPAARPAAWLALSARTPSLAVPTRDGTEPPPGETVAYDDRPARTGHAALPAKTSAPRAVSPCWLRSRPSCSCSAVTRRGMIRSVSL
jgi:hypothetical protein